MIKLITAVAGAIVAVVWVWRRYFSTDAAWRRLQGKIDKLKQEMRNEMAKQYDRKEDARNMARFYELRDTLEQLRREAERLRP